MNNENDKNKSIKIFSWFMWFIPLLLIFILFLVIQKINNKLSIVNVGKPEYIISSKYYKVDNVFIKPGDIIEPGREICSLIITSKNKEIPKPHLDNVVEVTVKKIVGEKFDDITELPGILQPYYETYISSQVSGKIVEIFVKEGDFVTKDSIIAKIEDIDYQIAYNRALSELEFSKNELIRVEQLLKNNASNLSNYESKKNDYNIKKANFENAQLMLKRCNIKAPFDGIIDKKFIEIGEIISPQTKLFKLIDTTKLKAIISIPEKDISYVKNNSEIKFIVPNLNNKEYVGKVKNIISSMTDIKVYPLILEVENKNNELIPNLIIKAQILINSYNDAVLLPIFSIIPGDDEYYTYIVKDNKACKKVLKLGSFFGQKVHILDGLKPGDLLIDKGSRLVTDGVNIKIINPTSN